MKKINILFLMLLMGVLLVPSAFALLCATPTISVPADGATVSGTTIITVTYNETIHGSNVTMFYRIGSTGALNACLWNDTGSYSVNDTNETTSTISWETTDLRDGEYQLVAYANITHCTYSDNTSTIYIDNYDPTMSSQSPVDNAIIKDGQTFSITVLNSTTTCVLNFNGQEYSTTPTNASVCSYTFNDREPPEGTYSYYWEITDNTDTTIGPTYDVEIDWETGRPVTHRLAAIEDVTKKKGIDTQTIIIGGLIFLIAWFIFKKK